MAARWTSLQMEVMRAAKAMRAAGIAAWRIVIEYPDGRRLSIIVGTDVDPETGESDLDRMIRKLP